MPGPGFEMNKLHSAAQDGDLDRVKELLEQGCDINAFDEDLDWTPLHYAVKEGHIDVAAYLIERGADVNAHNSDRAGETPLALVAQECTYEIAKLLVDAGADPTIPGWMKLSALDRAAKRKRAEGVRIYKLLRRSAERFR